MENSKKLNTTIKAELAPRLGTDHSLHSFFCWLDKKLYVHPIPCCSIDPVTLEGSLAARIVGWKDLSGRNPIDHVQWKIARCLLYYSEATERRTCGHGLINIFMVGAGGI